MGRPVKEPTPEERVRIETLAGYGLTQEQIGRVIGLHRETLRKHCSEELKRGKEKALVTALDGLFANIKLGKEASIFFYLKTQWGWREKSELEINGLDKTPLVAVIKDA